MPRPVIIRLCLLARAQPRGLMQGRRARLRCVAMEMSHGAATEHHHRQHAARPCRTEHGELVRRASRASMASSSRCSSTSPTSTCRSTTSRNHPRLRQYEHDHTKAWSDSVDAADAFVFVTPEYNYFAPPALMNAIDYVLHEWACKPAGIVSYGGASGGMRSAQMLKLLLTSREASCRSPRASTSHNFAAVRSARTACSRRPS